MKRVTLSLAVSIVLVGVIGSIAAMQGPSSPATGPTTGKTVVVVAKGIKLGIHENVRFESIGQHDFIIIPMAPGDTQAKYEVWLSLGEVDMLRVFDARDDAVAYLNAYANRSTRREALPSLVDESQDASNTQAPRGDVPEKVVGYARAFTYHYDTNKDGVLTEDEWAKMKQDYSSVDRDKDGRITPVELGATFARKHGGSSAMQTVAAEEGTKTLPDAQLALPSLLDESQDASNTQAPGGDVPEKVVKYAVSFIKRYDINNDAVLTQDEWVKMNQDYSSADLDKDGRITPMELGASFARKHGVSSAPQTIAAEEGTKTLPDAQLVWQVCKSESFDGNRQSIHRSKVPGGWLVVLKGYPETGPSITFYPDPQYVWDGTSLD